MEPVKLMSAFKTKEPSQLSKQWSYRTRVEVRRTRHLLKRLEELQQHFANDRILLMTKEDRFHGKLESYRRKDHLEKVQHHLLISQRELRAALQLLEQRQRVETEEYFSWDLGEGSVTERALQIPEIELTKLENHRLELTKLKNHNIVESEVIAKKEMSNEDEKTSKEKAKIRLEKPLEFSNAIDIGLEKGLASLQSVERQDLVGTLPDSSPNNVKSFQFDHSPRPIAFLYSPPPPHTPSPGLGTVDHRPRPIMASRAIPYCHYDHSPRPMASHGTRKYAHQDLGAHSLDGQLLHIILIIVRVQWRNLISALDCNVEPKEQAGIYSLVKFLVRGVKLKLVLVLNR
jgi:hypothetical protein